MILTLLIWIYITGIALLLGFGCIRVTEKITGYSCNDLSLIWLLGLVITTVYAEYFSLIMKVGLIANLGMILIAIFILVFQYQELKRRIRMRYQRLCKLSRAQIITICTVFAIFMILFVIISSLRAIHSDTDLYHAQAIRWIEEYGSVKGLGNLHNRLAYNSSFMCLQALFSGSFAIAQSTHVVNGYIAFCIFSYVIHSLVFSRKNKTVGCGDFFRLVIILYIFKPSILHLLASPGTDIFSLTLVLFLLLKWCEYLEAKEESIVPYGILCVIGLFSLSVKLSTLAIMLLLFKPAVALVKEKRNKEIVFFILFGLIVITPFLARNVITSGYLLYPYAKIDIFPVDWKMAKSVVDFDRKEIAAYAKNLNSYEYCNYKITQWFPIWWKQQALPTKVLVIATPLMQLIYIMSLIRVKQKRNWDYILLFVTANALFLFWLLYAPLIRYGQVFLLCIPCVVLGTVLKMRVNKVYYYANAFILMVCMGIMSFLVINRSNEISLKRSAYYTFRECTEVRWEGLTFYLPKEDTYCGYYYLPALPYEKTLQYIQLRGKDISDGFQVKEEVKTLTFNNSGQIYVPK